MTKRWRKKAFDFFGEKLKGTLVDVGSGANAWRPYLEKHAKNIFLMDISFSDGTSLLGDAHSLPFKKFSVDSIVSMQVLEHLKDPFLAVSEMRRVLKKGGYVLLTVPLIDPVHGYPHDFYRYTEDGIKSILAENKLKVLDVVQMGGTFEVLCHLINWTLWNFSTKLSKKFPKTLKLLPVRIFYPFYILTNIIFGFFDKITYSPRITFGYIVLARKQ